MRENIFVELFARVTVTRIIDGVFMQQLSICVYVSNKLISTWMKKLKQYYNVDAPDKHLQPLMP